MKWTESDNLHSRDAEVIDGPQAGLLVAVREQNGRYRYPDVIDLTGYSFDVQAWCFRWAA